MLEDPYEKYRINVYYKNAPIFKLPKDSHHAAKMNPQDIYISFTSYGKLDPQVREVANSVFAGTRA